MVDTQLKKPVDSTAMPSSASSTSNANWSRVVIDGVNPIVDGGQYPSKRVLGETIVVSANVYTDGHNAIACSLLYRKSGQTMWSKASMQLIQPGLDLWQGSFKAAELGLYEFTLHAWIDEFANWRRDTGKKHAAGQAIDLELSEGCALLDASAKSAEKLGNSQAAKSLQDYASKLKGAQGKEFAVAFSEDTALEELMHEYCPKLMICEFDKILPVVVESERALYGAWYELFPRSLRSDSSKKHGTLKDAVAHLPYVAGMGFDVLYIPPIHPIGAAHRKGKNNSLTPEQSDPGSPWAIGAKEGGHKSIHPELGTLEDFDELVKGAQSHNMDIAIDIAFQCSPDHPYVKEHPEWFYHRPDGSIRYAENPPKKYEDIYPINFECENWQALWAELKDVVLFWVSHGVKIFRVDNPHTKPFAFWQYLIKEVRSQAPDTVFLAEAFARPNIMYHLAKVGFSQSYTYFTWRNTKFELTKYFTELYSSPLVDYFRPNLFANTPDINPEFLQYGGRPGHMIRLVLAATLGATYGIYGPVFELCASDAMSGSEEYKDSEKYEMRNWDLKRADSLSDFIGRVNRIRKSNPALHQNRNLKFLRIDNEEMIAFAKTSEDGTSSIVTVVNLNPHYVQEGTLFLPNKDFGTEQSYQVHDLITGMRFLWNGEANFVRLDPKVSPAFVFKILKKIRTERDFDYFL